MGLKLRVQPAIRAICLYVFLEATLPHISESIKAVQGSPMAHKVLPALKVLRRVTVLPNPSNSVRVHTEAVLTTYGSQKIALVLACRQQVFASTAGCALSLS